MRPDTRWQSRAGIVSTVRIFNGKKGSDFLTFEFEARLVELEFALPDLVLFPAVVTFEGETLSRKKQFLLAEVISFESGEELRCGSDAAGIEACGEIESGLRQGRSSAAFEQVEVLTLVKKTASQSEVFRFVREVEALFEPPKASGMGPDTKSFGWRGREPFEHLPFGIELEPSEELLLLFSGQASRTPILGIAT